MESDLLKYTREYDLQNRLKALKKLNGKGAKCNCGRSGKNKVIYEFTIQDGEIVDPVKFHLSNDEEKWVFIPEGCDVSNVSSESASSHSSSGSIWDWLGFSPRDIQLSCLCIKNDSFNSSASSSLVSTASSGLSSLSSTLKDQLLLASFSSDQGLRKNVVDSRTYTRPKKRSFQTIVGRCFNDTISDENGDGQQVNAGSLTTTSSQNTTVTYPTSNIYNTENHSSVSTINNSTTPFYSALSNNSAGYASPSSFTTCSSSNAQNRTYTNNNSMLTDRTNSSLTTSLGIIDIDQLTNSQLGFNNTLDSEETQMLFGNGRQKQDQERKSSSPFTGFDSNRQSNRKNRLDETFTSSLTSKPEVLTSATISINDSVTNTVTNNCSVVGAANEKSKIFNTTANELLQISFPKDYLNSDTPPSVIGCDVSLVSRNTRLAGKNNSSSISQSTTIVGENGTIDVKNDENILENNILLGRENKDENKTDTKVNQSNNDGILVNCHGDNDITSALDKTNDGSLRVDTPPQQQTDFNNPIGFSTPTNTKNELRRKMTYDAITNKAIIQENGISSSGRLSDSSTDTDVPSISMEDLTEEQISPILNQTYNTSANTLNVPQNEKTLNRTYEMLPQSTAVNTTQNLSLNKSRNAVNNSGSAIINSSFRKSPLNATFCKSTEALNGGVERADSGPEDDCMSTASDSSFSSSSTHMRSVGEIQSIARLQEESLRQQTPRKKMAWTANEGLSDASIELRRSITKLSSDDGNQSDQSDRSSDRYSPTTLNNNDRGDENECNEGINVSGTPSLSSLKIGSSGTFVCSSESNVSISSTGFNQPNLNVVHCSRSDVVLCKKEKSNSSCRRAKKRTISSISSDSVNYGKRKSPCGRTKELPPVCVNSHTDSLISQKNDDCPRRKMKDSSTSPIRLDEINNDCMNDHDLSSNKENSDCFSKNRVSHCRRNNGHLHNCIKAHSVPAELNNDVPYGRQKCQNHDTPETVTAVLNPGIDGKRSPRVYGALKHFGGSSELYPSSGIPHSGNTAARNYDQARKPRMTGLRPPTVFNRVATRSPPPAPPTSVGAPMQPPPVRPSGIRPPSVIPRPVSRLPAPKVRSGLPKYNARGGRH